MRAVILAFGIMAGCGSGAIHEACMDGGAKCGQVNQECCDGADGGMTCNPGLVCRYHGAIAFCVGCRPANGAACDAPPGTLGCEVDMCLAIGH